MNENELRKKIEELDIDFGYAVGNLGEDCKNDTVERILEIIRTEVLKARIEGQIAAKQNMLNYNMVVKDAESAVEDSIAELTDQLQANQKEQS